ncbi:MAG TPA: MoaD/ThiS family protein [Opitutaceae bacterium]|nr:MoaD/ThiS family protein [Opitutaceae bacterium]
MKLHLTYFAILREQRGATEETVETDAPTARDLYDELKLRHRFSLPAERVRVAINGDFSDWSTELEDGQRVSFIPPVAGG